MWSGLTTTPRPVPGKLLPAAGAVLVLALSLLVFLIAGWSLAAWAVAAVLWVGVFGLGLLLGLLWRRDLRAARRAEGGESVGGGPA